MIENISKKYEKQKKFFNSGTSKSIQYRINSLKKLGLASEETSILFHKGVRDDPKLNVYKDISSGVIFIKDYDSGEDVNKTLNYRKENINKVLD